MIACFFCGALLFAQESDNRGLLFTPRGDFNERGTSALINNGDPIELPGSFSISFDVSFWYLVNSGQVFTVSGNGEQYLNACFNNSPQEKNYVLRIFLKDALQPLEILFSKSDFLPYTWNNIELRCGDSHTTIEIFLNDNFVGSLQTNTQLPASLRFGFGAASPFSFHIVEIPAMILRNIQIKENDEIIHRWDLNFEQGDEIFDSENDLPLQLNNPDWLINLHYRWKYVASFYNPRKPFITSDPAGERIFIDQKQFLRIFDFQTGRDSVIKYRNPRPGDEVFLIFDQENDLLYSTHVARSFVSTFDFATRHWVEYDTTKDVDLHYFGHKFWKDSLTNTLYSLGGYGWYTMKNSLSRYDFNKAAWIPVPYENDGLTPRCDIRIGKGFEKDEYLLFGGHGNENGKQERDFYSFADLYRFSLKDSVMRKITTFDIKVPPRHQGYVLYSFPKDSVFFTLVLGEDTTQVNSFTFSLMRWNIEKRTNTKTAQDFIYHGEQYTYFPFCYSERTGSFYLLIYYPDEQKIKIFTLRYPPLESDPLIQPPGASGCIILSIIFIVTAFPLFFVLRKKLRKKKETENSIQEKVASSFVTETVLAGNEENASIDPAAGGLFPENNELVLPKTRLYLFGGFRLIDENGTDFAVLFSKKIKEIFLLIAFRSFSSPQSAGITSEEISSIIWPDNSYESAKSNRNVSINKIRRIIAPLYDLKLEYAGKSWKLIVTKDFYCDFAVCQAIINGNGFEPQLTPGMMSQLLKIMENGELLSGMQYDWLNSFRATLNSEIIAILKNQLNNFANETDGRDSKQLIRICNAILKLDPVEEKAFLKKVEILLLEKKIDAAKLCYANFASEHKRLFGEDYKKSFNDIPGT